MLDTPFIRLVLLSFVAFGVGCDGGKLDPDPAGTTEVSLVITDPATAPDELAFVIDHVSYRITCPDSGLTPSFDDSASFLGEFEIDEGSSPPVWSMVTDLPLSTCTIALWVFYDDEVVCSGSEMEPIVDSTDPSSPNQVHIGLECSLSVNPPSGDAAIDGSFTFVHGNYCPQLIWLGAVPTVVDATDPPVTNIETYAIDQDLGCGQNCDPQTCDFTTNPPTCTTPPSPGLTTTLSAPAGNGTFGDVNAFNTTFTCDPLFPGPTEICVLASDGDWDCDRMRCETIICPDVCGNVDCDDGNECTRDRCDPMIGACANDLAPDGIACDNCTSTCQAGTCDPGAPFTADQNAPTMGFIGSFQPFSATLVNPYSGASIFVSGDYNVNTSSYKGVGANDLLVGTGQGDVLLVQDPIGTQRICGVETVRGVTNFDVLVLADEFVVLDDMLLSGGADGDLLWANVGDDTVRGNTGSDIIDGGPGNDIIEGGSGNDTITLWPGSGFDSIAGGDGADGVQIDAIQSQILITPAANVSYEFDIFYLGTPMAELMEVELLVTNDASIDLTTCTGGTGDVCNLCGNDALNGGEGCDDGNNVDGDGCAADCTAEF
jgi:cysteine-rich repeat protein